TWRYLSGVLGVRQMIHCGAPLPPGLPPHHAAWEAAALRDQGPVVYVEPDPVLAAKARVILVDHETVDVAQVDPSDVAAMLGSAEITRNIDLSERVVVIAPGLLHGLGVEQAAPVLAELQARLAPESFVVATHALDPETEAGTSLARRLQESFERRLGPMHFRAKTEIAALFAGYQLLAPGVVPCAAWWPTGPHLRPQPPCDQLIAGVG